jgi:DNA-binding response OmpR family regulator
MAQKLPSTGSAASAPATGRGSRNGGGPTEGTMSDTTILVVDDDPNAIDIVRTYLEAHGYHVSTASDGKEALAKLESVRPALVLLDVMMPGMDGWEVARIIKNHPQFGHSTRVVMLTARSDYTDKHEGLRSGADDYLVKPIQLAELGERVARNLKARETAR